MLADACDASGIENGVRRAVEQFGAVDIAVHNACLCTFENERDTGCEVYQKVMDVNYFGALRLTKACLLYTSDAADD